MNQSLMLNRPKNQTKRLADVEIESSQTKARLARQRMLCSNYAEVRCIQCEVRDGVLYLIGQVTSFYLKQLTQEAVRSLDGIHAISNFVEVIYPDRCLQKSDVSFDDENVEMQSDFRRKRSNIIKLPIVLMDVTECQFTSAGSQLTIGQR